MDINIGEVLMQTLESLQKRLDSRKIELMENVEAEIDTDRNRVAYMRYSSVVILNTQGKQWLVACGEACGNDLLAGLYSRDLVLIEVTGQNLDNDKVRNLLKTNKYFSISLLWGSFDGDLVVKDSKLGKSFWNEIREDLDDYRKNATKNYKLFKPEFVEYLSTKLYDFINN